MDFDTLLVTVLITKIVSIHLHQQLSVNTLFNKINMFINDFITQGVNDMKHKL